MYLYATKATKGYPTPRNVRVHSLHKRLEIRWQEPQESLADDVRSYVLEWWNGEPLGDGAGRVELSASTYKTTIDDLANSVDYSIRISAVNAEGDAFSAAEIVGRPRPWTQYVQEVWIDPKVEEYPWLQEVWYNVPPNLSLRESDNSCWGTYVLKTITLTNCSYRSGGVVLHEFGHHYSIWPWMHSGNVDGRLSVISGWLWLLDRKRNGSKANAVETYAGKMATVVLRPDLIDLTQTDSLIFKSASEGTIPDWFYDTYASDGTLDTLDHDRLWTDMRSLRCDMGYGCQTLGGKVADHAIGLFGGLCSRDEARGVLWGSTIYHSPWIDGGCLNRRPENLVAAAGSAGELHITWDRPLWSTGPAIDVYIVQWSSGNDSYDTDRKATATDLSDLSHTISGLAAGTEYKIRVTAANSLRPTDLTDDDGHSRSAEITATAP